jgi:hypothetical protein
MCACRTPPPAPVCSRVPMPCSRATPTTAAPTSNSAARCRGMN